VKASDFYFSEFSRLLRGRGYFVLDEVHNPLYFRYLEIISAMASLNSREYFVLDLRTSDYKRCPSCSSLNTLRENVCSELSKLPRVKVIRVYEKISLRDKIVVARLTQQLFFGKFKETMLRNSIVSALATSKYQSDHRNKVAINDLILVTRMIFQYVMILKCLKSFFSNSEQRDEYMIGFNGRFPSQVGVRQFIENRKGRFLSVEHGQPHGINMHFGDFQPQQIRKLDSWIKKCVLLGSDYEYLENKGESWLEEMSTNSLRNPFLDQKYTSKSFRFSNSKNNDYRLPHHTKKILSAFTSSLDERKSNFGVDLNGWSSQAEAFNSLYKLSAAQGFDCLVKIHPNSRNKAWIDLFWLYIQLEIPNEKIISPWSLQTAENVIDSSDFIVSWASSVNILASYKGKPNFLFGPTNYAQVLDVKFLDPGKLQECILKDVVPIPLENAKRAAGVVKFWGFPLESLKESLLTEFPSFKFTDLPKLDIIETRLLRRLKVRVRNFRQIIRLHYSTPEDFSDFLWLNFRIPRDFSNTILEFSFLFFVSSIKSLRQLKGSFIQKVWVRIGAL
jgi:hypothetical protein